MKTLIESTESSAKYEFSNGTTTKIFVVKNDPQITDEPVKLDFEKIAEEEYQKWLEWLNSSQPLDENGIEIK